MFEHNPPAPNRYRPPLTGNVRDVLCYVVGHPGCTVIEVRQGLGLSYKYASHRLTGLYARRLLHRQASLRQLKAQPARYYPEPAALEMCQEHNGSPC